MRYNTKMQNQNMELECDKLTMHKNVETDQLQGERKTINTVNESREFDMSWKGKSVKIKVEFPTGYDKRAEQAFTDRLKEIYLRKMAAVHNRSKHLLF